MNETTLVAAPEDMPEAAFDCDFSNFDHRWQPGAKEGLEAGEFVVTHSGWNFNAKMWRGTDGRFYSAVWRYHNHIGTVIRDTADELVRAVNDEYGDD